MEIEYKGATAVTLKTSNALVVIDPKLSLVGGVDLKVEGLVEVVTEPRFAVDAGQKILISGPGEYEVSNVSITGVPAMRHIDTEGHATTMYKILIGGFRVAVVGHISEKLSEDQLEDLGIIDILVVPVGGAGYTLDAHGALGVVKKIDPKIVIPIHYQDDTLNYEVPQAELGLFLKELGAVQHEVIDKFKLKNAVLPEVLTVIELTRS